LGLMQGLSGGLMQQTSSPMREGYAYGLAPGVTLDTKGFG